MTRGAPTIVALLSSLMLVVSHGFAESGPSEEPEDPRQPGLDNGLDIIRSSLSSSYVTAGGGLNLGDGHGDFDDLILEGDLNHHLELWRKGHWLVMVNPRVRLRMRTDESSPVRTPSFMPRVTGFYCFGDCEERPKNCEYDDINFKYLSLMVSHHSNGQAGSFYAAEDIIASSDERVAAGEVNTIDGSFSTNFVELGLTRVSSKGRLPASVQLWGRWHPLDINRSDALEDQYERVVVGTSFRSNTVPSGWLPDGLTSRANGWLVKMTGSIGYVVAGRAYVIKANPAAPQITEKKAEWHDNINMDLTLSVKPSWLEHISAFVKYDFGYDYYNINFQKRLHRLQIGLGADPFWRFD